jgi:UDP-glucose 6-dehydrogenase
MFQADLYNFKKRGNTMKNKMGFGFLRLPETEGKPDWNKISDIMNNNIVVDGRNVLMGTIPNSLEIRYYHIG